MRTRKAGRMGWDDGMGRERIRDRQNDDGQSGGGRAAVYALFAIVVLAPPARNTPRHTAPKLRP